MLFKVFEAIDIWLYKLGEKRRQRKLREEIIRQRRADRERERHYAEIKKNSTPIKGRIAEIRYMDFARLRPDNWDWEPEDIIFWIKFKFEDGRTETLQYYHRGSGDPHPEQRYILEYSGHPSLLEYSGYNTEVIGYFQGSFLVALDNVPPPGYAESQ